MGRQFQRGCTIRRRVPHKALHVNSGGALARQVGLGLPVPPPASGYLYLCPSSYPLPHRDLARARRTQRRERERQAQRKRRSGVAWEVLGQCGERSAGGGGLTSNRRSNAASGGPEAGRRPRAPRGGPRVAMCTGRRARLGRQELRARQDEGASVGPHLSAS